MNCHFRLCTTGAGLLLAFAAHTAAGQSNQEWIAIKQSCGLSSSLDYNSWVAAGSKCNSGATPGSAAGGLTPQQQIGAAVLQQGAYSLGQGLHNWLFGQPQQPTAPLDAAAQQRALAAQQLKNSGIYLLKQKNCVGAINEFQQALFEVRCADGRRILVPPELDEYEIPFLELRQNRLPGIARKKGLGACSVQSPIGDSHKFRLEINA